MKTWSLHPGIWLSSGKKGLMQEFGILDLEIMRDLKQHSLHCWYNKRLDFGWPTQTCCSTMTALVASPLGIAMTFDPDLGPLAPLLGTWEGSKGTDLAPSDKAEDNRELTSSLYRERMVFEATGRVDNHEQQLFGLRYSTKAWRVGADDPFHEEVGYWMWDAASKLIIRCFMPPRGMTVLAGGTAEPDARRFSLEAKAGSETFGICSSPFLLAEFKTVRYTLSVEFSGEDSFHYEEHTWLQMKGRKDLFDHSDENTLQRVS